MPFPDSSAHRRIATLYSKKYIYNHTISQDNGETHLGFRSTISPDLGWQHQLASQGN